VKCLQICIIINIEDSLPVILLVEVRLAWPWISAPPAAYKVNIGKKLELTIAAKKGTKETYAYMLIQPRNCSSLSSPMVVT
jgi:hypothetical protein